jgi:hypothetical protein
LPVSATLGNIAAMFLPTVAINGKNIADELPLYCRVLPLFTVV